MTVRRVLYIAEINPQIQAKLRIISFEKATKPKRKNQKNQKEKGKNEVFYVQFATETDADVAAKKCRRLGNMTLVPYLPRGTNKNSNKKTKLMVPLPTFTEQQHTILSQPQPATTTTTHITPMVRHIGSLLAPNSRAKCDLLHNLNSCMLVMETARKSAEQIRKLIISSVYYGKTLQRFWDDHSAAFYMKAATLAQLKAASAAKIHLSLDELSEPIRTFNTHVVFESELMLESESTRKIPPTIKFRPSSVLTTQLLCEMWKLVK